MVSTPEIGSGFEEPSRTSTPRFRGMPPGPLLPFAHFAISLGRNELHKVRSVKSVGYHDRPLLPSLRAQTMLAMLTLGQE